MLGETAYHEAVNDIESHCGCCLVLERYYLYLSSSTETPVLYEAVRAVLKFSISHSA